MRLGLAGYSLGNLLGSFLDGSLSAVLLWGLSAAGLLTLTACRERLRSTAGGLQLPRLRRPLHFATALCLGLSWHGWWAHTQLSQQLPAALEGRDIAVIGEIISSPQRNSRAQRFEFYIYSSDAGFARRKVLLNYYGESLFHAGQLRQFTVRLNKPHGYINAGAFDYEAWLFQKKIAARGYVRLNSPVTLLGHNTHSIEALRASIRQSFQLQANKMSTSAALLALTFGERSEFGRSQWRLFTETGTNHLFVISGLHIGMVAAISFWMMSLLHPLVFSGAAGIPRQKLAACAALVGALLYSLLAGFTLPTQRAFIMIAIFMSGYLSQRPSPVSFRFLLALACVLTLNPLAGMSAGFWLSFLAVAALLGFLPGLPARAEHVDADIDSRPRRQLLKKFVKPQIVVFLGLLVPVVIWTGQLSLLAPLVNIFAIPLVGFVVVPLCLAGLLASLLVPEVSLLLLSGADYLLRSLFFAMHYVVSTFGQWSILQLAPLSVGAICAASVGVLLMLLTQSMSYRFLCVPLLLPVFLPATVEPEVDTLSVYILDVGQGLAVILKTRHHTVIYDTGAGENAESNLGTSVIVPVLKHLGVRSVDAVVVSHGDNDHAGGLPGILAELPVTRLYSGELEQSLPVERRQCLAGEHWRWDAVDFSFLHPQEAGPADNNHSCVLQVRVGEHRLLLPGDIEARVERELAIRYGDALRSAIVLAPHHGSNTSSSYAFIKRLQPRYVVFSAGYHNSFGHPASPIVARYKELGAQVFTTSETGMLSFSLTRGSPIAPPVGFREQYRRYWR